MLAQRSLSFRPQECLGVRPALRLERTPRSVWVSGAVWLWRSAPLWTVGSHPAWGVGTSLVCPGGLCGLCAQGELQGGAEGSGKKRLDAHSLASRSQADWGHLRASVCPLDQEAAGGRGVVGQHPCSGTYWPFFKVPEAVVSPKPQLSSPQPSS